MISIMQFRKMLLHKGCRGFITHVKEVVENKRGLRSVPMVREFPEELPGLLLEREIDFKIN